MKTVLFAGIIAASIIVSTASCSQFVGHEQAELQATTANSDSSLGNINVGPSPVSPVGSKNLPIHPSRDPKSPTGVFIPETLPEAVSELRKSLATWYIRSLSRKDRNGATVCRLNDEDNDLLVIYWMKQFWMLGSKTNDIVKSSSFELRGEMFPDLVANSIFNGLCPVYAGA